MVRVVRVDEAELLERSLAQFGRWKQALAERGELGEYGAKAQNGWLGHASRGR
eukprot:SAG22_NODE_1319_length_4762_cov_3.990564_4_plen_53_part_00